MIGLPRSLSKRYSHAADKVIRADPGLCAARRKYREQMSDVLPRRLRGMVTIANYPASNAGAHCGCYGQRSGSIHPCCLVPRQRPETHCMRPQTSGAHSLATTPNATKGEREGLLRVGGGGICIASSSQTWGCSLPDLRAVGACVCQQMRGGVRYTPPHAQKSRLGHVGGKVCEMVKQLANRLLGREIALCGGCLREDVFVDGLPGLQHSVRCGCMSAVQGRCRTVPSTLTLGAVSRVFTRSRLSAKISTAVLTPLLASDLWVRVDASLRADSGRYASRSWAPWRWPLGRVGG